MRTRPRSGCGIGLPGGYPRCSRLVLTEINNTVVMVDVPTLAARAGLDSDVACDEALVTQGWRQTAGQPNRPLSVQGD